MWRFEWFYKPVPRSWRSKKKEKPRREIPEQYLLLNGAIKGYRKHAKHHKNNFLDWKLRIRRTTPALPQVWDSDQIQTHALHPTQLQLWPERKTPICSQVLVQETTVRGGQNMSYADVTRARALLRICPACGLKRAVPSKHKGQYVLACHDEGCGAFSPLLQRAESKPPINSITLKFEPALTFFTNPSDSSRRTANGPEPKRAENAKPPSMTPPWPMAVPGQEADCSVVQTPQRRDFSSGSGITRQGENRGANSLRHRRNRLCAATQTL